MAQTAATGHTATFVSGSRKARCVVPLAGGTTKPASSA